MRVLKHVLVLTHHSTNAEGREVIISRRAGEAVLRGAPVFMPGVIAATAGIVEGVRSTWRDPRIEPRTFVYSWPASQSMCDSFQRLSVCLAPLLKTSSVNPNNLGAVSAC